MRFGYLSVICVVVSLVLSSCTASSGFKSDTKEVNTNIFKNVEDFKERYDNLLPGMDRDKALATMGVSTSLNVEQRAVVVELTFVELYGEELRLALKEMACAIRELRLEVRRLIAGDAEGAGKEDPLCAPVTFSTTVTGVKIPYVNLQGIGYIPGLEVVTETTGTDLAAYLFFTRELDGTDRLFRIAIGGGEWVFMRETRSMVWGAVEKLPAKVFSLIWAF